MLLLQSHELLPENTWFSDKMAKWFSSQNLELSIIFYIFALQDLGNVLIIGEGFYVVGFPSPSFSNQRKADKLYKLIDIKIVMKDLEQNKVGYQFTPIPKHLMHLLDVNCRTMLFSLVDDSNYFTNSEGWFYRSNSDLQNDSKLSKNLVTVTIDTLFLYGIVDVSCVGKGNGKQPNGYRLCAERFPFFEQLNMNTDICRPENQIKTIDYKGSGYSPSYLQDEPLRLKPMLTKRPWNVPSPMSRWTVSRRGFAPIRASIPGGQGTFFSMSVRPRCRANPSAVFPAAPVRGCCTASVT